MSTGPISGPGLLDIYANRFDILFNSIHLKPTAITNIGNDYTITLDPPTLADVLAPMGFYVRPNISNTGNVRMRNGTTHPYYSVLKYDGSELASGEWSSNTYYHCAFLEGAYRILSVIPSISQAGDRFLYFEFFLSTTWVKPLGIPASAEVLVEIWGGGGGGSSNVNVGGGGGGAYNRKIFKYSDILASTSITIGAGGTISNPGGTTSFGSQLFAFGGGGAGIWNGHCPGGGGGITSVGGTGATATLPILGGYPQINGHQYGGSFTGGPPYCSEGSLYGGGAGASPIGAYGTDGGTSIYGGGGGGTASTLPGISIFGGNGGANIVPGAIPGGGGGVGAWGAGGKCNIRIMY